MTVSDLWAWAFWSWCVVFGFWIGPLFDTYVLKPFADALVDTWDEVSMVVDDVFDYFRLWRPGR